MADRILKEDDEARRHARIVRDGHWRTMEELAEAGTQYWRPYGGRDAPDNVVHFGFLAWANFQPWLQAHPEFFEIGPQDKALGANPVSLTAAGIEALANRELYDMEPVEYGAVEPGCVAVPSPVSTSSNEESREDSDETIN